MGAVKSIHGFDDNKDSKSNDEKINDVLDEISVSDMSNGVSSENVGNIDGEGGKI